MLLVLRIVNTFCAVSVGWSEWLHDSFCGF